MRNLIHAAAAILLASVPAAASAQGSGCKTSGPKSLVLGVWIAPPSEMAKWKHIGLNTIISVGDGVNIDQHDARANQLGLYQIRRPRDGRMEEDLANPGILAFETADEPTNIVNGSRRESPDQVSAEQKPWRDAMRRTGKCKPVFTNHIGNHIWHRNSRVGLELAEYHRRSDWYGADTYQIAGGEPNLLTQDGFTSTFQGHILHHQRIMSGGAPLLSFVQTAAFRPETPIPTPGQLKTQIWSSIIHGASMIGVFPVRLGPVFAWDATPAELVSVLRSEFAELKAIESVLIDAEAGGARQAKIYYSAPKASAPKPGQLAWPFEARIIPKDGRAYTIVVNLSDAPAFLTMPEWGVSDVAFEPHEVKHGYGREWTVRRKGEASPKDAEPRKR